MGQGLLHLLHRDHLGVDRMLVYTVLLLVDLNFVLHRLHRLIVLAQARLECDHLLLHLY